MKKTLGTALLAGTMLGGTAWGQDVTLTIESWRNDDLAIWQEKLIPAFEAKNPGIKVVFAPSAPTEYNAALNAKLDAGSAGRCRADSALVRLHNPFRDRQTEARAFRLRREERLEHPKPLVRRQSRTVVEYFHFQSLVVRATLQFDHAVVG